MAGIMKLCFCLALLANCACADVVISGNASFSGNFQTLAGSLAAPTKAVNAFPANGAGHIEPSVTITWSRGGGSTGYNVYLDKASEHNPPTTKVVDNDDVLSYAASGLDANTEYVYRVDAVNNIGTTTGDVVTFTTLNPTVVTSIIRFEDSTNTTPITTTILDNVTVGPGTWAITPDPAVELTISTEQAFTAIGLKLADDSGYVTTTATRSLRCANDDDLQRIICTLDQHAKVSIGFALYLGAGFGSTDYSMDFCQMISGTGISPADGETNDFSAANWQDNTRRLKAHTLAGKDTGINVMANGRWYWVTILWDPANLLTTTKVYDTTTRPWALLNTSSLALKSFNMHTLQFGHIDNTGGVIGSPHYFGVIAVDTTGAAWPLLPDEAYRE